jgi:hypothetical protein
MRINSTSAHRSTQGFATRRVRVTGAVEGGRLPFVDLTDGGQQKRVYVTNILAGSIDTTSTGHSIATHATSTSASSVAPEISSPIEMTSAASEIATIARRRRRRGAPAAARAASARCDARRRRRWRRRSVHAMHARMAAHGMAWHPCMQHDGRGVPVVAAAAAAYRPSVHGAYSCRSSSTAVRIHSCIY